MKLIVGLGNPGKEYENTPHNAGFEVLNELAARLGCAFRRSFRFKAHLAKVAWGGQDLWLVKPQTYMNRSGMAVAAILRYHKLAPSDLVVVLDDADLELGLLRVRAGGSGGGHKGMASVIQELASEAFPRVRVGIGRAGGGAALIEQVLTPYTRAERQAMHDAVRNAGEAILCVVESGPEAAMNRFNRKNRKIEDERGIQN